MMSWDPLRKPVLRPVEVLRLPDGDGAPLALFDRSGLSDVRLAVSEPTLGILSLMDGTRTCEDIRREFGAACGQTLSADMLRSMLEQLEQAHLLEGPGFEAYYKTRQEEYRKAGTRAMQAPAALGMADDCADAFAEILGAVRPPPVCGEVAGLIAPHLDYARGKACYAAAYSTLLGRAAPDCVVILGTNHFGRATSVVATASDFATPLGTTHTDVHFLARLEAQCSSLRACELDHLREHSIELQVVWLQHLFGADSFQMVPLLCPDPCGRTGTAPCDGNGVDLRLFALELGRLIAEDKRDILLVAGADLSHVGPVFGDGQTLDEALLEQTRQRDKNALDHLCVNDPPGFVRAVAKDDNPTRVCSAGCIFALATALPGTTGTILRYHQAVDRASQMCVTCAAVAFT